MNSLTQTNQQDVAVENHSQSRILIFGDSWPFGAELDLTKEKPYGTLIAEYMNWPTSNYSRPATSIDHLLIQLLTAQSKELSLKGCKALFTLTSPSRRMYYQDGEYRDIQIRKGDSVSKSYYANQWSTEMDHYQTNLVVLGLQTMCKTLGINDFYVAGFELITLDYPGINTSKFYDEGQTCLADIAKISKGETARHPDQQGHQLIAEKLQSWIANC